MRTKIKFNELRHALENAKVLKSDVVLIPRVVYGDDYRSSICGSYYNSVYTYGYFQEYTPTLTHVNELWSELPFLRKICLHAKDIQPFIRECTQLNIPLDEVYIEHYNLQLRGYDNQPYEITKATKIISESTEDGQYREIELMDYQPTETYFANIDYAYNSSESLVEKWDTSKDSEFSEIMNSKAAEGGQLWIPDCIKNDDKYKGIVLTLSSTFLNVSKGDKVYLTLKRCKYNDIPHSFFVVFDIVKPKKKCTLSSYMWCLETEIY